MKKRLMDERRSKISVIAEKVVEIGTSSQDPVAAVAALLTELGLGHQEGVKIMVNQQEKFTGVVTPAGLTDGAGLGSSEGATNAAEPPPAEGSGGNSSGIISEGELFDEFIDGNVNNSMIFANYTNSGNLTLVFNFGQTPGREKKPHSD